MDNQLARQLAASVSRTILDVFSAQGTPTRIPSVQTNVQTPPPPPINQTVLAPNINPVESSQSTTESPLTSVSFDHPCSLVL